MIYFFLIIAILLLIFLEASIITIPLILIGVLLIAVVSKKSWIFPLAFLAGIMLDLTKLNSIGETSLFLIIFLFVILLYDRKFEIKTLPFIYFSSFLGSFIYLAFSKSHHILPQAIISSVISVFSFMIVKKLTKKDSKLTL